MKTFITALLIGLSAQAANIGESSFTAWLSNGSVTIDIRETDKGEILGRSGFGTIGMINLKYENGSLKGVSDDGFTDITCTATRCEGIVGSGTVNIDIKNNGTLLEGSINHVYVRAEVNGIEINISADSSVELQKTSDGKYSGSGVIQSNYISQISLKSKGTLVDRVEKDPAFLIAYLISPLVRN